MPVDEVGDVVELTGAEIGEIASIAPERRDRRRALLRYV
jgi:hypothetical protein